MANLSVTAANVLTAIAQLGLDGSSTDVGIYGATVTAGQPLYRDTLASFKLKLALATSATTAVLWGISLNGGGDGQPAVVLRRGLYNPGGTVVVGMAYYLSATSGAIAPYADLVTGNFVSAIGIGITASLIYVDLVNSGIAKP